MGGTTETYIPDLELYLFMGKPERCLDHLKTLQSQKLLLLLPVPSCPKPSLGPPVPVAVCLLGWAEQDFRFPTSLGASGFLVCFLSKWEMYNEKLFKQLKVQGNSLEQRTTLSFISKEMMHSPKAFHSSTAI